MKQVWMLLIMTILAFAGWNTVQAAEARREWTVSLSVEAKAGDSKTTEKSKGGKTTGNRWNRQTTRTTQKTTVRNKKWVAHVSCSGKNVPEKAKLKVFFIGYTDGKLDVLGEKEYTTNLEVGKRNDIDIVSPDAVMVKTTTTKQSRRRGGGATSKTTGERMSGCVIQLSVGEEIVKTYATQSAWISGLHNEPFSAEKLEKK